MPVTDEDAAILAVSALTTLSDEQRQALSSINQLLLSDDPFVDIHELIGHYDVLYFRSVLLPRVEVLWSPRLTLCAGVCELSKDPTSGKFTRIRLKMSTPLLQYRPRSDTINTLLHEAIHAYFFVTSSWRHSRGDDGTGHGAGFQLMADAINNHGGYDITVYHTFHDEVDSYRTHIWQCDGPCRQRPPYFGLVKRSMNRPPGKTDTWWSAHLEQCGGQYAKISQPEMTKKQREALSKKERAGLQKNKIDSWVTTRKKPPIESKGEGAASTSDATQAVIPPKGMSVKRTFEAIDPDSEDTAEIPSQQERQRPKLNPEAKVVPDTDLQIMVQCPICCEQVAELDINHHLDVEHPP